MSMPTGPQVIVGRWLWNGFDDAPLEGGMVRIEEDRIVYAGPRSAGVEASASVVDLGNVTLMPGLINAHGHLGLDAGPDIMASWHRDDDNRLLLRMAGAAQRALRSGTTTFQEMGARNYLTVALRDAINEALLDGSRLLVCGQQLTIPGGQGHDWGAIEVESPDEIRQAVNRLVDHGADFLKVMVGGGRITPSSDPRATQFTIEQLEVLVDTAHRRGRRVVAHAHSTESIRRSVLAGCDSVEHASWYGDLEGINYDEDVVRLLSEQGTYVAPTLAVSFPLNPPASAGMSRFDNPMLGSRAERLAIVKRMFDAGVKIVAGNDAGGWYTPVEEFAYEIMLLHEAGLPTRDALRAATVVAAECIGLAEEIGTLEEGKRADLLAVQDNPFERVEALFDVQAVYKDGRRLH